jgi:hypothetical protein
VGEDTQESTKRGKDEKDINANIGRNVNAAGHDVKSGKEEKDINAAARSGKANGNVGKSGKAANTADRNGKAGNDAQGAKGDKAVNITASGNAPRESAKGSKRERYIKAAGRSDNSAGNGVKEGKGNNDAARSSRAGKDGQNRGYDRNRNDQKVANNTGFDRSGKSEKDNNTTGGQYNTFKSSTSNEINTYSKYVLNIKQGHTKFEIKEKELDLWKGKMNLSTSDFFLFYITI